MAVKFEPGMRVRVYGGIPAINNSTVSGKNVGEITEIDPKSDLAIQVRFDFTINGMSEWWVCPQQCRRLKPKPKVKKEAREARRVWMIESHYDAKMLYPGVAYQKDKLTTAQIEFREVLRGEIPITYEKLAKAWNESGIRVMFGGPDNCRAYLDHIAKSLGLERKG